MVERKHEIAIKLGTVKEEIKGKGTKLIISVM